MDARGLALRRACEIEGDTEALALRLGVSRRTVHAMLEGKVPVTQRVFLDLVDIITAEDLRLPGRKPATGDGAGATGK